MPLLSRRTRSSIKFDLLRLSARLRHQLFGRRLPPAPRLHFGCGRRVILGWTNVDVCHSPFDIDLAAALPWPDQCFDAIASQQVIEHLDLETEFVPLLRELARVARPGAELWLSCPDLAKVCMAYAQDRGRGLLADRNSRFPARLPEGMPSQQVVNILFHQSGEHKNLYDAELLGWLLAAHGFGPAQQVDEATFRGRFPEFPVRGDDEVALYVRALRQPRPVAP